MQRWKYTAEFMAEAVKQVVDKGHTVVNVASRLRLGEGVLYNWVRKSKAADGTPLGDMHAMQAEVAKLKAELRRTTCKTSPCSHPALGKCRAPQSLPQPV